MREVILVRHGPAFDHDPKRWPDDDLRPLSPEGIEKFRKTAMGVEALIEPPDRMFASPLLRARQTAQLLTEVARWPAAEESKLLVPEGTPASILNLLDKQSDACIVLVGHEPSLSLLAATALAGSGSGVSIEMKKGSLLCLAFPGAVRAGNAMLKWLLPPRLSRR